ncbi:MAG: type II toxin-antitoxin system RelE/ParE family toxin, partial [Alphaproteobacteria bacterium]
MAKLVWAARAQRDVERLGAFLADKDRAAAERAVEALMHGMKAVEAFPMIGRAIGDPRHDLREWIIPFGASGYVVLYRAQAGRVLVVRPPAHQKPH